MKVFTYSEARQRFSDLLDLAKSDGKVLIKKRDGTTFALTPELSKRSPLDIKGIKTNVSTKEIVEALRETRGRLNKSR